MNDQLGKPPAGASLEDRAVWHYKNNPLAKCFVDVLAHQIEQDVDRLIVTHALAHAPLLMQLDMAMEKLNIEKALETFKPKAIFDFRK